MKSFLFTKLLLIYPEFNILFHNPTKSSWFVQDPGPKYFSISFILPFSFPSKLSSCLVGRE